MDGNLQTTSFEQLCHDLAERRSTGTLRITHGADEVRVTLREGVVTGAGGTTLDSRLGDRLVHSRLLGRDDLTRALAMQAGSDKPLGALLVDESLVNGHVVRVFVQEQILDALFWPLRWTTGDFTFTSEDVPAAKPRADLTVPQLLYALESRHRTWDEVTHTIPTTSAVPEFVPGADPSMASLEAGENAVLAAVDGRRSMEEIADDLGFSTFEVGVILHGLAVLGLIRLQASQDRSTELSATEAPDAPLLTAPATVSDATPADEPMVQTPRTDGSDVDEPATFVLSTDDEPPAEEAPAAAADEEVAAPAPAASSTWDADGAQEQADTADFFGGGSRRDVLSGEPAPSAPAASAAPTPSASPAAAPSGDFFEPTADDEYDDDLEVWTMDIGGDDDEPKPEAKPAAPRSAEPTPIAAPVTPTPMPTPEPADPAPTATPDDAPPKPSGGDVSDLLRELRQLSDD